MVKTFAKAFITANFKARSFYLRISLKVMSSKSKISIEVDGSKIPVAPNGAVKSSFHSNGLVVEKHSMEAAELPEHAIVDHRLAIFTGDISVPFEFKENGNQKLVSIHPEEFSMQNHGDY